MQTTGRRSTTQPATRFRPRRTCLADGEMRSVVYRSPGYALSVLFATWLLQLFCAANAIAADPISEGRVLYQGRCGGCHSVETNRIGPRHRGVVGRPVASVPDYDYSPALKQLGRSEEHTSELQS